MTISSAQPTYSTISDSTSLDTITISDSTSLDTITITASGYDDGLYQYNSTYDYGTTITLGPLTDSASTISTITIDPSYTFSIPIEWVNSFPDFKEIEKMREEYPALDIAFKKFQEVYKMVEDDYVAKKGGKYTGT